MINIKLIKLSKLKPKNGKWKISENSKVYRTYELTRADKNEIRLILIGKKYVDLIEIDFSMKNYED